MAKKTPLGRSSRSRLLVPDPKHLFRAKRPSDFQSPLTDSSLAWAEKKLGVRLPSSYTSLLRQRNGGYLRLTGFLTDAPLPKEHTHRKMYEVERIAGIHRKHSESITCLTPLAHEEWGIPEGLCAFDGDGHWWACLDYRKCGAQGEPSITHYDTEFEMECEIAPSFGTFVNGLVYGEEEFLFAFDDPDLDRDTLHKIMKGIGCRKHSLPGMSKSDRAMFSAWVFPRYRNDLSYPEHAYLVVHPNGDEDDPAHLARPGQHPLLHVSVLEKDQDGCIRAIAEALGDRAHLIHHPFDRKAIRGLEVSTKKFVARKKTTKTKASAKLVEEPKLSKNQRLMNAIRDRNTMEIRALLESGINPNRRAAYCQWSFLAEAAIQGSMSTFKLTLGFSKEPLKDNSLPAVVFRCKPTIAKYLLDLGIKPRAGDLIWAVERRDLAIVKLYLANGVAPTPHCVRSASGARDLGQYGVKNRTIDKPILRALQRAWAKPLNAEMRTLFDRI